MRNRKTKTQDMTSGPILRHLIAFALPLLFGNIFQMLYNTVDSIVVGNFVGTEALAAIGSTTVIVNLMVFFFNGVAVGGSVVIGNYFGAKRLDDLHRAVETTMAITFLFGIFFTIAGVLFVPLMLRFMATPADVFEPAKLYLKIYFAGSLGLLIYNMGSGILRAVGDSARPLFFLIFTSILNTILDLIFVIGFKLGIAGAAWATVLSQFLSAIMVLVLLTKTHEIYALTWNDLSIDRKIMKKIMMIGLPTGVQASLTSLSNIFVQSYVNGFGSICMAGWACYTKLDSFIFLPIASLNQAATTFVSQNIGAEREDRVHKGTVRSLQSAVTITFCIASVMMLFAPQASSLFTSDQDVIGFSTLFIRTNTLFLIFNTVNHVLAGALRGRGDSSGPMICMLVCFVAIRQIYLFIVSRICYTPSLVGFGYPVGWMTCCIAEVTYYRLRWARRQKA